MALKKDKNLYWIRGARMTKMYLAYGRYADLVPDVRFLVENWRYYLERIVIFIQGYVGRRICGLDPREQRLREAWHQIMVSLPHITDAFLLHTAEYKQTWFVGVVRYSDGSKHFIKAFKDINELSIHQKQAEMAHESFSSYFNTVRIEEIGDHYILYEFVPRNLEDELEHEQLYEAAMEMATGLWQQHKNELRRAESIIVLDMPLLFNKHDKDALWQSVYDFFNVTARNIRVPVVPTHGDFTPWNCFRDEKGGIVLVDYERSGWHVPFYDVMHLIVQPPSVARDPRPVYPDQAISEIIDRLSLPAYDVHMWFLLYLLDQLNFDLSSYYNDHSATKRLKASIDAKMDLLAHVLGLLQKMDKPDRSPIDDYVAEEWAEQNEVEKHAPISEILDNNENPS